MGEHSLGFPLHMTLAKEGNREQQAHVPKPVPYKPQGDFPWGTRGLGQQSQCQPAAGAWEGLEDGVCLAGASFCCPCPECAELLAVPLLKDSAAGTPECLLASVFHSASHTHRHKDSASWTQGLADSASQSSRLSPPHSWTHNISCPPHTSSWWQEAPGS